MVRCITLFLQKKQTRNLQSFLTIYRFAEDEDDNVAKRTRGDETNTVAIIPSTDFATKILPRAITEVTALAELVDNGVEATIKNNGERIVRITFESSRKTLIVEDNGCGIDESRVVDCFSLGHSERSAANIEHAHKTATEFDTLSTV